LQWCSRIKTQFPIGWLDLVWWELVFYRWPFPWRAVIFSGCFEMCEMFSMANGGLAAYFMAIASMVWLDDPDGPWRNLRGKWKICCEYCSYRLLIVNSSA
jgi:hypothetical protein